MGHFILIDCDIICIFYWIKDILCSLIRIIQNHPEEGYKAAELKARDRVRSDAAVVGLHILE